MKYNYLNNSGTIITIYVTLFAVFIVEVQKNAASIKLKCIK